MKKKNLNLVLFSMMTFITPIMYVFAEEHFQSNICSNEGVTDAMFIIGRVLQIIKIVVPLIIIVLGMIDFGKAAISGDDSAISKATSTLIKRFVAGLAIFFVPTIVAFISREVLEEKLLTKQDGSFWACTNCLFNPNSCAKNN